MSKPLTRAQESVARAEAWNDYQVAEKQNYSRQEEVMYETMYFDEGTKSHGYVEKNAVAMRYASFDIGLPGENGYPLYIALHGGGQTLMNEQQFKNMQEYYRTSVQNGIYVACRGIRETYNTHFNPESYPLYDRLIQNMILFKNVDPNRVYILGFSAGGDGVYGTTPCMPDRFAAVAMSAGHHNQTSPINYMNTPILLQCGEEDTAYDRHLETARYGEKLKDLQAKHPGHYIHEVNMHVKRPHNFRDNNANRNKQVVWEDSGAWLKNEAKPDGLKAVCKNTNSIDFLNKFTRNPLPKNIAWNLATRAPLRLTNSYYWLKANQSITEGIIHAEWDKNTFTIKTEGVSGKIQILLNWDMVDFDQPINLVVNGQTHQEKAIPTLEIIEETTKERGDVNYQFSAIVEVTV